MVDYIEGQDEDLDSINVVKVDPKNSVKDYVILKENIKEVVD